MPDDALDPNDMEVAANALWVRAGMMEWRPGDGLRFPSPEASIAAIAVTGFEGLRGLSKLYN